MKIIKDYFKLVLINNSTTLTPSIFINLAKIPRNYHQ